MAYGNDKVRFVAEPLYRMKAEAEAIAYEMIQILGNIEFHSVLLRSFSNSQTMVQQWYLCKSRNKQQTFLGTHFHDMQSHLNLQS